MSIEAKRLEVLAKLEEEKAEAMIHYEKAMANDNLNTAAKMWVRVVMHHQAINAFRHVHKMKRKENI